MGGVCSLDDRHNDMYSQPAGKQPHPAIHPHHLHNPSASALSAASPQPTTGHTKQQYRSGEDDLPRDVTVQRMWTSVVVGELVKRHAVSMYDDHLTVHTVVQAMVKAGANYAMIRQPPSAAAATGAPAAAVAGTGAVLQVAASSSGQPRSFRAGRRQRDTYVGLFDWRDLNALLVAVCKTNRLHGGGQSGGTPAAAATATPQLRIRMNSSMSALDEDGAEFDDGGGGGGGQQRAELSSSTQLQQKTPASQPRPLHATVAAVVASAPSAVRASPGGGGKRAIQLAVTDPTTSTPASPNRAAATSSIPPPLSVTSPSASASASHQTATAPSTASSTTACTAAASASSTAATATATDSPLQPYLHFLDMKRAPVHLVANLSARNTMQVVNTACPLLGGAKLLVGLIGNQQAASEGVTAGQRSGGRLWDRKKKGSKSGADAQCETRQELYRLTVLNKDGVFVGCMTQLALCQFVQEKLDVIGALADAPLHELGLGRARRVLTISWKSPVLTALLLMHDKRLSALAIVNDGNGRLVGTISCSDVKYLFLAPELLLTLQRPVSVFVAALRQSATLWHVNLTASSPPTAVSASVTVTPRHTLRATVDVMLASKVRRAWVVNESEQPIGVVSISDIVKFALPTTPQMSAPTPAHNPNRH